MDGVDVVTVSHRELPAALPDMAADCDFVYYLAAVHRPDDDVEYDRVNHQLFRKFLEVLRIHDNACPVVFTSSVQAAMDNPYGRSKRRAEEALAEHCAIGRSLGLIFRLPNLFGPHARPFSHSVVATFCFSIARDLPIDVHDPARLLTLCHVHDVVGLLAPLPFSVENRDGCHFHSIPQDSLHRVTLGDLAAAVQACRDEKSQPSIRHLSERFRRQLCSTYRSYVPDAVAPSH